MNKRILYHGSEEIIEKPIYGKEKGYGEKTTKYRLKDWGISNYFN